jgi:hypothetical protein
MGDEHEVIAMSVSGPGKISPRLPTSPIGCMVGHEGKRASGGCGGGGRSGSRTRMASPATSARSSIRKHPLTAPAELHGDEDAIRTEEAEKLLKKTLKA